MPVARSRIHLDADPRRPRHRRQRVPGERAHCPRADRVLANMPRLIHSLDIPIEMLNGAAIARVEYVTVFVASRIEKVRIAAVTARVVRRQIARPDTFALDTHTAERQIAIGDVVEISV